MQMQAALLILMATTLCACSSATKSADPGHPIELEFKAKAGESAETRYVSNSRSLVYEDKQLLRDRTESVDFTVQTYYQGFDPTNKLLKFKVKTISKDGQVDLHEMAFPELFEEIDYIQRSTGEILKAGNYSPQGLFYVPSLPMPHGPVQVGDTWAMEHTWVSSRDAIPLRLEVIGILKGIVPCEKKQCADMEISGGVNLVAVPTIPGAKFESRVWGRLLFSLERGDVMWSEMRSQEEMTIPGSRTVVSSCMTSEMKAGEKFKTGFACDPKDAPVTTTPKL